MTDQPTPERMSDVMYMYDDRPNVINENTPQCPSCGYTHWDVAHMFDHHLCKGPGPGKCEHAFLGGVCLKCRGHQVEELTNDN